MHAALLPADTPFSVPVWLHARGTEPEWLPEPARRWIAATGFDAAPGKVLPVPGEGGVLAGVVFGVEQDRRKSDPFITANLARDLPAGVYRIEGTIDEPALAVLGFLLGRYRFDRYRKSEPADVRLVLPRGVDGTEISGLTEGVGLARDLVNTPSNEMGPDELEGAARNLAERHGARFSSVSGAELESGFPLIHAVGCSSPRRPRLLDLAWGDQSHPRVTVVGKGVCFDTGGLDIKPSSAMLIMKKDMGGAANALGLAHMIMHAGLPVRLRVLIPAVENAVSGESFRPGDVYRSRKGPTVEIGNTDAEGRLVLADALALADEEAPELLIDLATLTGAARVALGPALPPVFTDDDALAEDLVRLGAREHDPVWRLPFWNGYERMLDSKIADLNNAPAGGHAGAITAALFLRRFVERAKSYAHLDIFAWTPQARPGRPEGGEAHAIRAIYALLKERYPRP
ncbi:leucyl aminopeptidase family protein [Terrihabitans rhizophilus]|uniref:Leucyl aminopeptidase family protein n=1 Tax=Terrihabitans rhizophilus TaxID=3092662 RepID=A0ABU4RI47_9HYPH|nr:leucyl aminopeptidase family protein [Terrihabitans sp. PJ23]MDX6804502.1 leucyl aminopeptidase family protein [Terrihabitans sp. PJ23]